MINDVLFVSLASARLMRPRRDTLMISILDLEERQHHRLPRLTGYRSVLSLSFEDTYEEVKLAAGGSWPDEPTPEQQISFAQGSGEAVPTLSDARRIVDFVTTHHRGPEALNLLVHCYAGVSRSGAVAHWVNTRLGVPLGNEGMASTASANKRLLRLMDKAYDQVEAVGQVDHADHDEPVPLARERASGS